MGKRKKKGMGKKLREWMKKGMELEKEGLEITVIGRYPKPGFGMPRESTKK